MNVKLLVGPGVLLPMAFPEQGGADRPPKFVPGRNPHSTPMFGICDGCDFDENIGSIASPGKFFAHSTCTDCLQRLLDNFAKYETTFEKVRCTVERRSGAVEHDWHAFASIRLGSDATLQVAVGRDNMHKTVMYDDFTRLNPDIKLPIPSRPRGAMLVTAP